MPNDTNSQWRIKAREVLATIPTGLDKKATERLILKAYPFGDRQFHPYKIWLEEVKQFLDQRFGESERERQRAQLQVEMERRYGKKP